MEEYGFEDLVEEAVENAEYPYEYNVYQDDEVQSDVAQVWIRQNQVKYGLEAPVLWDDDDELREYHVRYLLAEFDRRMLTDSADEIAEGDMFPRI